MTTKEAYQELYMMQTEEYAEAERFKVYKMDGGRHQRRAEALTVALTYLLNSGMVMVIKPPKVGVEREA